MKFVISYELCSLFFLAVIAAHFFSRRKFPNIQNRFFSFFIICGMADILLDVVGSVMINNAAAFPFWLIMVVNTLFYTSQIMLPAVLFLYMICLTGEFTTRWRTEIIISMIPMVLAEVGVIANLWNHMYFGFDAELAYFHGSWYYTLFICMGFYLILTICFLIKYRAIVRRSQFLIITVYVFLILVAAVFQAVLPEYLLTGVALAISICLMYLTLQNPSEMQDDMTGLFNRSCFIQHINDSFTRGRKPSLVLIAIDNMRMVNNTFGTIIGNDFLIEVAEFLNSSPKRVQAFRLISDQFVLVCSDKRACTDAVRVVTERFQRPWSVQNVSVSVTACVCYSSGIDLTDIRDDIFVLFEYIISAAKSRGRGAVMEIDVGAISRLQRERSIEAALAEAVENDGLDVYLQPICSPDGRLHSAEALVRFRHETLGMIPPDEFIPLAERNGAISKIGELVLRKLCSYIKSARLEGIFEYIEMNLSAVELLQPGLARRLLDIMDSFGVPPSFLNFEITETTATVESSVILENMQQLLACGSSFALDDFGTGYANLDSAMRLPFSTVKLDRSMLLAGASDSRSAIVLQHMITLIKALGLTALVEGAETEAHVELLKSMSVDYIQGYYFSRPLPMADFSAYISRAS